MREVGVEGLVHWRNTIIYQYDYNAIDLGLMYVSPSPCGYIVGYVCWALCLVPWLYHECGCGVLGEMVLMWIRCCGYDVMWDRLGCVSMI